MIDQMIIWDNFIHDENYDYNLDMFSKIYLNKVCNRFYDNDYSNHQQFIIYIIYFVISSYYECKIYFVNI